MDHLVRLIPVTEISLANVEGAAASALIVSDGNILSDLIKINFENKPMTRVRVRHHPVRNLIKRPLTKVRSARVVKQPLPATSSTPI